MCGPRLVKILFYRVSLGLDSECDDEEKCCEEASTKKTTSIDDKGKDKEKEEHSPFIRTTFEEVWNAVVGCCSRIINHVKDSDDNMRLLSISNLSLIGIEGWMVFSRFISMAQ